jgi:hypothetical protein
VQISGKELRQLASSVDDQHRDAMRTVRSELEEVHFGETARFLVRNRRRFLKRAGAGGAILTVGSMFGPLKFFSPAGAQETDAAAEIALAQFAASVELAAVAAYQAAIDSGKVTDSNIGAVATLFQSHHMEHAGALNGLVTANGGDAAPANASLLAAVGPTLQAAADQTAVLDIAFGLEQAAASTYLLGMGILTIPEAFNALASILPIEAQHATALGAALGKTAEQYLPPFESTEETAGTAAALDPTALPIEG